MIALTALAVAALPAALAWRLGWVPGLVALALGANGVHRHADHWRRAHRAAVHARAPVDFRALDEPGRADARESAGAITGTAKIVGWLPAGTTGAGLVLLALATRARREG